MPRANRTSTGFLNIRPDKFSYTPLSINNSSKRDIELWMILEQYSEISEIRNEFIRNLGIKSASRVEKVGENFRSFVRQAKNYYISARELPNSSSALLYYYSFLNLAKALLILYHPNQISRKVYHGLVFDEKRQKNFKDEHVSSHDGVFGMLYEHETGETLNRKTFFSISKLLGYCTDISYQYISVKFGKVPGARGSLIIFLDQNRKKAWGTLAMHNIDELVGYRRRMKDFSKTYEKVVMDKQVARECFKMLGPQRIFYSFYEGKEFDFGPGDTMPEKEIIEELWNSTKGLIVPNHYNDESTDFYLAYPYAKGRQFLMNEFLSIYVVMFYLSSLVRYQPYYLDKILDKKESWLINGFMESCPETFLLYIVSKITKRDYVFTQR